MAQYNLSQNLPEGGELGRGDFSVGRSKCINVLLVGRSQTGKSTIVQTLLDPQKGTSSTGFSDTREPAFHSLILMDERNKVSYQLNIIDTPGLQEVREHGRNRRDDELLKLASKCVEQHITSLNVVCLISKAGETHRLDTEVFHEVKKFLGDKYSEISMMVLTYCDEYDKDDLEKFEQSIRSHNISKPYFEYCKLGIVRCGAINNTKLKAHKESIRHIILQDTLEKNEEMRNNFLRKIISCADKGLMISELQQIYDEHQKEIDEKVKTKLGKDMKCVIQ